MLALSRLTAEWKVPYNSILKKKISHNKFKVVFFRFFLSSLVNAWVLLWTGNHTSPSALVVLHPASLFLKAGAWPISRQVRRRISAWWWASATTAEHTIPFRADEQRLSRDSSAWTVRWNIHATDRGLGNHSKLQRVLSSRRDGGNYQSKEASDENKVRLIVQLLPMRSQLA